MFWTIFLLVQAISSVAPWDIVDVNQQGNATHTILLLNETILASLTECLCSPAQMSCTIPYSLSDSTVTDVYLHTDNMTLLPNTTQRTCSHTHDAVLQCSPMVPSTSYCHGGGANETFQVTNYTCSGRCLSIIWILEDAYINTSWPSDAPTQTCSPGCVAPPQTTTVASVSSFSPTNITVFLHGPEEHDDATGVIVGVVLGLCAAAFLAGVTIVIIYRRKRKATSTPQGTVKGSKTPSGSTHVLDTTNQMYNSLYTETPGSNNIAYSYSDLTKDEPKLPNKSEYDTAYSENANDKYCNPDEYEYMESINDTDCLGYLVLDNSITQTAATLDTKPTMPRATAKNDSSALQDPKTSQSEVEYENVPRNFAVDMSVLEHNIEETKRRVEDNESVTSSSSNDSIYINENL